MKNANDILDIEFDNIEFDQDESEVVKKVESNELTPEQFLTLTSSDEAEQERINKLNDIISEYSNIIYPRQVCELLKNNLLPDYIFVRNAAENGTIYEISTFSLKTFKHNEKNFFETIEDVLYNEFNLEIKYYSEEFFNEAEKDAKAIAKEATRCRKQIIDSLNRVYGIVIDPRAESGVFKDSKTRKYTYNMFSNPEVRKFYMEYAEKKGISDKSFAEHFNFDRYPTWKIILENLTNPQQNKMHYQNGTKQEINGFEHFIKFLNYTFTKIGKTNLMPIFVSEQPGAGKGVLMKELYSYVFGDEYYTSINNKTLTGGFNGIMENKLFAVYDEGQIEEKEFTKVGGALKSLVTEEKMIIEKKGVDQVVMDSLFNMIINTNRKRCIPLDTNDRRAWVFITHNKSLEERVVYEFGYKSIKAFLKELVEQRDAFLKDLFTFSFDEDELVSRPIMSEGKRAMISSTNTMGDVIISHLKNGDEDSVRAFFADSYNENADKVEYLIENMKAGFIDAKDCSFLYDMVRDEKDKNMKQSRYWDIHLNASKNKKYTIENTGKQTSYSVREINSGCLDKDVFEKRVNIIKGTQLPSF